MINVLREQFVCPKCRHHLNQFCALDPPHNYNGEEMFLWSWRAHENVNRMKYEDLLKSNVRLAEYSPFPYLEAKKLYFDKDPECSASCNDAAGSIPENKINVIQKSKFGDTVYKPNIFRIVG